MKISQKHKAIIISFVEAIVALFLLLWLLPKCISFFAPFVIGLIIACIANPLVRFFEKRLKLKRKFGSVIIIVLVIAIIVLLIWGLSHAAFSLSESVATMLPQLMKEAQTDVSSAASSLDELLSKIPGDHTITVSGIVETIANYFSDYVENSSFGAGTVGVIKNIPNALVFIIMMFMSAYFFIADKTKLLEGCRKIVPTMIQDRVHIIYKSLVEGVVAYLKAQIKIMFIIYVILAIGLAALKVHLFWLIAFGVAFLDMLPVFGAGTILCPWAVIQIITGDYKMAIGFVILYIISLIVHQAVQPKLIGDQVGMNTFVSLFWMYLGWKVYGVLGMIIAIPVGMIVEDLYHAGTFDGIIWAFKSIGKEIRDMNIRREEEEKKDGKDDGIGC